MAQKHQASSSNAIARRAFGGPKPEDWPWAPNIIAIKNAGTASATTVSASPTARALAREDAFAIGNLPIFLDAVHNRVIPSAFFASVVIKSDFNLSTCDRIQSLLPTRRTVPGAELDAAAKPMVGRNSGPPSR